MTSTAEMLLDVAGLPRATVDAVTDSINEFMAKVRKQCAEAGVNPILTEILLASQFCGAAALVAAGLHFEESEFMRLCAQGFRMYAGKPRPTERLQ